MTEWKPIETAPKDGSFIIVTNTVFTRTAWYHDESEQWYLDSGLNVSFRSPTHWMPLPPPPQS